MHKLPFGALVSEAVLATLREAAVRGQDQTLKMIPEIRLVEIT
jgi:hypothetical protein